MSKSVDAAVATPQLNFVQNVAVGAASAMGAVPVIQPFLYWKNTAQAIAREKAAGKVVTVLSKCPLVWYRGTGAFAASFGPTTALQTGANGLFSPYMHPLLASFFSGVATTIVVTPAEKVLNEQQRRGTSLFPTVRAIAREGGAFKGLFWTAVRDGGSSCAYLGAAPFIKQWLLHRGYSETQASLFAGVIAGGGAAFLTQPFDTRKTQIQRGYAMEKVTWRSFASKEAFAGFGGRFGAVTAATAIMFFGQEKIKEQIIKK